MVNIVSFYIYIYTQMEPKSWIDNVRQCLTVQFCLFCQNETTNTGIAELNLKYEEKEIGSDFLVLLRDLYLHF